MIERDGLFEGKTGELPPPMPRGFAVYREDSEPEPVPSMYVRPELTNRTYVDDEGVPIDYGRRWGDEPAPGESYEVVSHPERYADLHAVAESLIAYLRTTYDVAIDGDSVPQAAVHATRHGERTETRRIVHVSPSGIQFASLTFEFTDFPGVVVGAGVLAKFAFPDCGCDACDSPVEVEAENLENLVFTVVEGNFRERYPVGRRRWYEYALTYADGSGSESSQGGPPPVSEEKLNDAESRLASLGDGWQPWPLRRNP